MVLNGAFFFHLFFFMFGHHGHSFISFHVDFIHLNPNPNPRGTFQREFFRRHSSILVLPQSRMETIASLLSKLVLVAFDETSDNRSPPYLKFHEYFV